MVQCDRRVNGQEGDARYGSAPQEKTCLRQPSLSLARVKTIRHEMVSAKAAVGVYTKLFMSVALHKIYPHICPFLIMKYCCNAAGVLASREDAVADGGTHPDAR